MHEEMEKLKTECHTAKLGEQAVLQDLYKLRDKIMSLAKRYDERQAQEIEKMRKNPKTYKGPANDYSDPEKANALRKHSAQIRGMTSWSGEQDIELICQMFMDFLTTPTAATAIEMEISTPPKPEAVNIPSKMLNKDVEADDGLDE